jgi:hypothetical protein
VDASVTTTDAAGNSASSSDTESYSVDTSAPTMVAQTFTYNESQVTGAVVATLVASDNIGINGFKFAATNTAISADGFYQISNSGVISLTATGAASARNDFEAAPNTGAYDVTASDAAGNSRTSTITLNEANIDEAPTAQPIQQTGTEDTALILNWAAFGANDVDTAQAGLSIRVTSLPVDGVLRLNGVAVSSGTVISKAAIDSNQLVFTPDAHESGIDGYAASGIGNLRQDYANFNYQVFDGNSNSAPATMRIDINPVADAPIVNANAGLSLGVNFNGLGTGQDIATPAGWTSSNTGGSRIEINPSNVYGIPGLVSNVMELERNAGDASNFYTDVNTIAGQVYTLTFDYSPRSGNTGATSSINVRWGSTSLATQTGPIVYTTDATAYNTVGWTRITVNVVGTGSPMRLEFDAVDANATTSYGGLLDNIAFVSAQNAGAVNTAIALSAVSPTLVDSDGSETITAVNISAINAGATISDGTNSFTSTASTTSVNITGWNLSNLTYTSPTSGTDDLTISATTREITTGTIATSSNTLRVVVMAQQTDSNSADLLVGSGVNDNILAGNGADEIHGLAGNDILRGGAGNDTISGGTGSDLIQGGSGTDSLTGGTGSDTFYWTLADKGAVGTPSNDVITDFSTAAFSAGGDALDLRDLLQGENATSGTGNLGNYLHFEKSGANTIVHISSAGGYSGGFSASADDQTITLNGIDLTTAGNDQAIILELLSKGKLIVGP